MKKKTALILCILMLSVLFMGCAQQIAPAAEPDTAPAAELVAEPAPEPVAAEAEEEAVELVVFAAASMTETLNRIVELYKAKAPNVTILLNLESSGTLKTQIEEGAVCDLFISAAQKQMNALDISKDEEANPDRLDFVLEGSRINLLENKVVLAVPEGNPAKINSFLDIANCKMIALGNDDVPVGQYSTEILTNLDLLKGLEDGKKITYGSNVKEVTTQVSEGVVDCGIVYATDAFSAGLSVTDQATKDMCKQVVYPAAVMKNSENPEAAQAFLDYLQSPEAVAVFESVGFAMAS